MRQFTLRERMRLGDTVGRIRARQKCSQAAFGKILGVSQSVASNWECGARMPTRSALQGLIRMASSREASVLLAIGERLHSRRNTRPNDNQIAIPSHAISIGPRREGVNV